MCLHVQEQNSQIPKVGKVWHVLESTSAIDQIYRTNKETSYAVMLNQTWYNHSLSANKVDEKLPPHPLWSSHGLCNSKSMTQFNTNNCNHTRVLVTNICRWLDVQFRKKNDITFILEGTKNRYKTLSFFKKIQSCLQSSNIHSCPQQITRLCRGCEFGSQFIPTFSI